MVTCFWNIRGEVQVLGERSFYFLGALRIGAGEITIDHQPGEQP